MKDNTVILEASSKDMPEDNYRIRPGDSQDERQGWPSKSTASNSA